MASLLVPGRGLTQTISTTECPHLGGARMDEGPAAVGKVLKLTKRNSNCQKPGRLKRNSIGSPPTAELLYPMQPERGTLSQLTWAQQGCDFPKGFISV